MTEVGGSRFAVGTPLKNNPSYELHTLSIKEGDSIYLSTDGYQDQFGGKEDRKFMISNMRELLLEIHKEPIDEQNKVLDDTINNIRQTEIRAVINFW